MKKLIILTCVFLSFVSCKNEAEKTQNILKSQSQDDELITMKGEFIYIDNAAVLKTNNDIYGVVVDDRMKELDKQVKPYKSANTDMVPVTVKVRKFAKPDNEEGWPYRVEIKEVIKVEKPEEDTNDIIKLGN